jgi:hypothetical protein
MKNSTVLSVKEPEKPTGLEIVLLLKPQGLISEAGRLILFLKKLSRMGKKRIHADMSIILSQRP